jgi:hypothetical protein
MFVDFTGTLRAVAIVPDIVEYLTIQIYGFSGIEIDILVS